MTKERFTTSKGVAHYPYISKPDEKYGGYKVELCLSQEDAQPMIDTIKKVVIQGMQAEKKANPNKAIKQAPLPFKEELDEDGTATGNILIKFKSGEAYKPAVFDSKGNVMMNSNIWAGSVIRVSGTAVYYNTPSLGAGATLRLNAVQVIEYVQGSDGSARFGFTEEEGYTVGEDIAESASDETPDMSSEVQPELPLQVEKPKPKVVQAIKPVQQVKPKPVEEPKEAPAVSGAEDLAAEIAKLVGEGSDD